MPAFAVEKRALLLKQQQLKGVSLAMLQGARLHSMLNTLWQHLYSTVAVPSVEL